MALQEKKRDETEWIKKILLKVLELLIAGAIQILVAIIVKMIG